MGVDKPPVPPSALDANVEAGLRAFGMPDEEITRLQAEHAEAAQAAIELHTLDVYADNWDSWEFFLEVQTQWVYAPSEWGAQRRGLNYSGVESGARLAGRPSRKWPALFADLRVMELAVLRAEEEKRASAR